MALAEHLHAKTYWEKRSELAEESLWRVMRILLNTALPPVAAQALSEHMRDWDRLLSELGNEFKPETPDNAETTVR